MRRWRNVEAGDSFRPFVNFFGTSFTFSGVSSLCFAKIQSHSFKPASRCSRELRGTRRLSEGLRILSMNSKLTSRECEWASVVTAGQYVGVPPFQVSSMGSEPSTLGAVRRRQLSRSLICQRVQSGRLENRGYEISRQDNFRVCTTGYRYCGQKKSETNAHSVFFLQGAKYRA